MSCGSYLSLTFLSGVVLSTKRQINYRDRYPFISYNLTLNLHYCDVIMGAMGRKSPASWLFTQPLIQAQINQNIKAPRHWPFVRGIHRLPVNSPHKWPVTRKIFPFDDVIVNNMHVKDRNGLCRKHTKYVRVHSTGSNSLLSKRLRHSVISFGYHFLK